MQVCPVTSSHRDLPDAAVARGADARICLGDEPHGRAIRGDYLPSLISRAIIHYNNFNILESLIKDAFKGFSDIEFAIVGGNNDGDSWLEARHAKQAFHPKVKIQPINVR